MDTFRIMVVDDEPGMRLGVARALRDFMVRLPDVNGEVNFQIDQAATGEEALEKIEATPPQILLLDYKLPGMSGLDVLEKVAGQEDMLTIMITAYASLETAVTATKRGAYDFLAKPFTPEELKSAVRKAAGRVILSRQARRLAAEKRQVRFQFIRTLAHELKSPLAAIEGYLRIIKDRQAGEKLDDYEPMIERSLLRLEGMRKLIFDLLDVTRIESGTKRRDLAELDVREVARDSIEAVHAAAAERNITVELDAPEPVTMTADRGEIEIILNNLVSNAVKYNRDGGRVDVKLRADQSRVTIQVADTGIGMKPEDTQRLFEDFVRIKSAATRDILGSGLGLSIVRKLAGLYGGSAAVESTLGEGSTFTVTLDCRTEAAEPETDASAQPV
jgi:signal transduction histidine kinase